MIWKWIVFVTVITLLMGSGHLYLYRKMVRNSGLSRGLQRASQIAILIILLGFPLSRWLNRNGIDTVVFTPLFLWIGLAFFLTLYFFAADVFLIFYRVTLYVRNRLRPSQMSKVQLDDPVRRQFIHRSLAAGGLFSSTSIHAFGYQEAFDPKIVKIEVPILNLPLEFERFRIAQITDLHVGPIIKRDFVEKVVDLVNETKPNMVALTGDFVDGSVTDLQHDVEPLGKIRCPEGIYFVTGNHEFYSDADPWCDHFSKMGFQVLRNEMRTLKRSEASLQIAGIEDWSSSDLGVGPDLNEALKERDPRYPTILLAHQPKGFEEASLLGVDLQISGHTHGGQIWPLPYVVPLFMPYVRGLHRLGSSHIYVSCGTGFWGPLMRLGAPSEITLLELRRGGG